MDVRLIAWLISDVGFPIAVSCALLWFVFFQVTELRHEVRSQTLALEMVATALVHIDRKLAHLAPIPRNHHAA